MIINNVKLDKNKYEEIINQKKEQISMDALASKKELQENDNTNVSIIALEKLGQLGFNTKSFSTLLFANIIEDLYYERTIFDGSEYFNLAREDNEHYKYLVNRYKVGNEILYRSLIAREIGITDIEIKNINEIAYKVVNELIKELDKECKILFLSVK